MSTLLKIKKRDSLQVAFAARVSQMVWGGFAPVYREGNRLWLRHPDRDTIIRIEVTELPRQDWPSLPELVR